MFKRHSPTPNAARASFGVASVAAAFAAAIAFTVAAPAAFASSGASPRTPALDQREANQASRIRQGARSGELTRPETRRLLSGQAELRRDERHARADGVVTRRERAALQHEADQQSRRIHRQKHDAQDRR